MTLLSGNGGIKQMKRLLCLCLILPLAVCCWPSVADGAADQSIFTSKTITFYYKSLRDKITMPVYTLSQAPDLPFITLKNTGELLNVLHREMEKDARYSLTYEASGDQVTLTRENGFYMKADFAANKIIFSDYNAFNHNSTDSSLMDLLSFSGFSAD